MLRLLYVTDTHIRGTAPRSRTDDFVEALRNKLNEVIDIAGREKVNAVLHGGDLFDRPDLSPAVVRDFARLLRRLEIPVYTIAGNHDIYGHNPETVDRSMLGLLDAFGTVGLIRSGEKICLEEGGIRVQLTGQPFHYDLDRRDPALDYVVKNETGADYCVHMVHGMVVDRALPDSVPHTLTDHLWSEEVDVLLTGHYHAGFPIKKKGGRYIINPGALARINNHPSEISRHPQVALLDFGSEITVKLLPLKCAAPGEEVLDRSWVEQAAYREERIAAFEREIRDHDFRSLHVQGIVEEIAGSKNVEDEVRHEALRRIAVVQEHLGTGRDED
ncbi:exonuclease SbcD [Kroppenstedtia guangzhouensis]|jgi:DNA repair protein SbcD/Mre11|uniref:Exonuclease SbcD n=1 Tax=Kroppenstedtia guangzhouensis TaxID=1274356 RepID=A0ABQ1G098_9BACL|nr:metallophosphoesterase [Kroppenstedtia guangzhouensis]GGA34672.1 exonuclease SbcD [Kroppenstedtia guangzhouensis]